MYCTSDSFRTWRLQKSWLNQLFTSLDTCRKLQTSNRQQVIIERATTMWFHSCNQHNTLWLRKDGAVEFPLFSRREKRHHMCQGIWKLFSCQLDLCEKEIQKQISFFPYFTGVLVSSLHALKNGNFFRKTRQTTVLKRNFACYKYFSKPVHAKSRFSTFMLIGPKYSSSEKQLNVLLSIVNFSCTLLTKHMRF